MKSDVTKDTQTAAKVKKVSNQHEQLKRETIEGVPRGALSTLNDSIIQSSLHNPMWLSIQSSM